MNEELRKLVQEQIEGAQADGMHLGIKYAAKVLRETADGCALDPRVSADYVRGLRDAAVVISGFAATANEKALEG